MAGVPHRCPVGLLPEGRAAPEGGVPRKVVYPGRWCAPEGGVPRKAMAPPGAERRFQKVLLFCFEMTAFHSNPTALVESFYFSRFNSATTAMISDSLS